MATTFVISCNECEKQFNVSQEMVGKKIRCKECGNVLVVKKPRKSLLEDDKKKEKPKDASKTADAKPKNLLLDDEEENKDPYQIIIDDEGIARCPNCAKELESLEATICLNCGYNTVTRGRHERVAVYEATSEDKFHWWLPGILCCVGILVLIGISIFCSVNTKEWMKDGWFYDEEKPEKPYMVKPGCFIFGNIMITFFACLALGRFAYKRLVVNNKPPEKEIEKHKGDDDD